MSEKIISWLVVGGFTTVASGVILYIIKKWFNSLVKQMTSFAEELKEIKKDQTECQKCLPKKYVLIETYKEDKATNRAQHADFYERFKNMGKEHPTINEFKQVRELMEELRKYFNALNKIVIEIKNEIKHVNEDMDKAEKRIEKLEAS